MTTIYLVRHGEAEGNAFRRIHGQYDTILTPTGFRQTEALAKRLAAEDAPPPPPPEQTGPDYTAEAQKDLASRLGRGVRIVSGRKKGRIELEYYGVDDLNDLLEALALLRVRKSEKGSAQ